MDFSETSAASDMKVGRSGHILNSTANATLFFDLIFLICK